MEYWQMPINDGHHLYSTTSPFSNKGEELSCSTITSTTTIDHRNDRLLDANNSDRTAFNSNYAQSDSGTFESNMISANNWSPTNNDNHCFTFETCITNERIDTNGTQKIIKDSKKRLIECSRSSKSNYKHVPHREKPIHLVARRNARERKRVQAVNSAFVRLRKCVPVENRNKRLSKVKTLHRAIEYIAALEDILHDNDQLETNEFTTANLNVNDDNIRLQTINTTNMTTTTTTTATTATIISSTMINNNSNRTMIDQDRNVVAAAATASIDFDGNVAPFYDDHSSMLMMARTLPDHKPYHHHHHHNLHHLHQEQQYMFKGARC